MFGKGFIQNSIILGLRHQQPNSTINRNIDKYKLKPKYNPKNVTMLLKQPTTFFDKNIFVSASI